MVAAIRRALRKIHSLSGLVSLIRPSLDIYMLAGWNFCSSCLSCYVLLCVLSMFICDMEFMSSSPPYGLKMELSPPLPSESILFDISTYDPDRLTKTKLDATVFQLEPQPQSLPWWRPRTPCSGSNQSPPPRRTLSKHTGSNPRNRQRSTQRHEKNLKPAASNRHSRAGIQIDIIVSLVSEGT